MSWVKTLTMIFDFLMIACTIRNSFSIILGLNSYLQMFTMHSFNPFILWFIHLFSTSRDRNLNFQFSFHSFCLSIDWLFSKKWTKYFNTKVKAKKKWAASSKMVLNVYFKFDLCQKRMLSHTVDQDLLLLWLILLPSLYISCENREGSGAATFAQDCLNLHYTYILSTFFF